MRTLFALLLMTTSAFAQSSPYQLALSQRLLEEISTNIQLRAQLIEKEAEIKKVKDELEAKVSCPQN